ncbi:MAG: alpha/beta hydrolase [Candidatus Acidiferrales bacterium]
MDIAHSHFRYHSCSARRASQPHPDIDFEKLMQSTVQPPTSTGIAILTRLNKPALIIASAQSPLLDMQKQMAVTIPSGKFVIMDGRAHAVFADQPANFYEILQSLLQSLPNWS